MAITKEQFWQLYEKLPEEMKEAILSPENSEAIYNIAKNNNILDQGVALADIVGETLLGILPPKNLPNALKGGLKLESDLAQQIARQINQQILSRVQRSLFKLYETPADKAVEERIKTIEEKLEKMTPAAQTKIAPVQDVYREPIVEEK